MAIRAHKRTLREPIREGSSVRYVLYGIVALVVIVLAGGLGYGSYRTLLSELSPKQEAFANGTVPLPMPDGFLKGSVAGDQGSWKGKKMDAQHHTGLNIFAGEQGDEERYPFRTYLAKGLHDPELDVLRIDYDLPSNPFWLRRITDEIVQVESGTYLGKVHLRILPGYPFTMGYFRLERSSATARTGFCGAGITACDARHGAVGVDASAAPLMGPWQSQGTAPHERALSPCSTSTLS